MRNTSKMTTLENKFPLLAVEQGCIISKDADITYNRQIKKFPTEKQNVSLKHILT